MNELTEKRVLRLMSEHLGVERSALRDNACLMDLMDQLDFIELIMALEEECGSEIPDEEAENLKTVGDAIKYIESKAAAKE